MMQKILLILVLLNCFAGHTSRASECYNYHTTTVHEVRVEHDSVFWISTSKDPNGISIAWRKKVWLKGIHPGGVRIIAENRDGVIVADQDACYWLDANPFTFEEKGPGRIMSSRGFTRALSAHTFCVDGAWKHVVYNSYSGKTEIKNVPGLTGNAAVLAHFDEGREGCFLLKDSGKVYAYDDNEGTLTLIPGLDAATTRFEAADWAYDAHFLYDDHTFYLVNVNFDDPDNITEQFRKQGLNKPFTEAVFRRMDGSACLDFNDGVLWGYIKAGADLNDGSSVYFFPAKDARYVDACNWISSNGQLYSDPWDMLYQRPIDVSKVKQVSYLRLTPWGIYTDGVQAYYMDYVDDIKTMTPVPESAVLLPLMDSCRFYPGLLSYQHQSQPFWANDKEILYWNANVNRIEKRITHTSPVKDLEVAYAFDDQLLIEGVQLYNIADRETMSFVGSASDVISGCDGGEGRYPVVVEYNYYFKDRNAVYRYHSGQQQLERLAGKDPGQYNKDNFFRELGPQRETPVR